MRFQSLIVLTGLLSSAFALSGHHAVQENAMVEVRSLTRCPWVSIDCLVLQKRALPVTKLVTVLASIKKADKTIISLTAQVKKLKASVSLPRHRSELFSLLIQDGAAKVSPQLKAILAQAVPGGPFSVYNSSALIPAPSHQEMHQRNQSYCRFQVNRQAQCRRTSTPCRRQCCHRSCRCWLDFLPRCLDCRCRSFGCVSAPPSSSIHSLTSCLALSLCSMACSFLSFLHST